MARQKTVRQLITDALPKRELPVSRTALINTIVQRIEAWKATEPLLEPHAKKVRQLVAIADRLSRAVNAATTALLTLGVEQEIEAAKAQRIALGIDPKQVPLAGHSVAVDLFLIPWRASDGLKTWKRIHRPGKHRPRGQSAALTAEVQRLCLKAAGFSKKEFEDFLQRLNDSLEWTQAGLPKLVPSTLKKRMERDKKKRGPN